MVITRVSKAISLVAVVCLVANSLGQDDRAQKYLLRSMNGEYRTNIIVVMRQKSSESGTMIVKIQKSTDGKTRETNLSPLHLQREFLNDGKTIQVYLPDDKTMIVQPSPSTSQDVNFRMPLIQKNYVLKSESGKKVAGRTTVMVTATARSSQVPSIRYYFDEKTGFPLCKEILVGGDQPSEEYEVLDIKFPAKIDKSVFKIEPAVGFETITYGEPVRLNSAREAEQELGFTPIIPSQIPFGFQIQRMTLSKNSNWKSLYLKLTDGLQNATVHEWVHMAGEKIKTGENKILKVHNGLSIVIVSDIENLIPNALMRIFLVRNDRDNPAVLTSIGF